MPPPSLARKYTEFDRNGDRTGKPKAAAPPNPEPKLRELQEAIKSLAGAMEDSDAPKPEMLEEKARLVRETADAIRGLYSSGSAGEHPAGKARLADLPRDLEDKLSGITRELLAASEDIFFTTSKIKDHYRGVGQRCTTIMNSVAHQMIMQVFPQDEARAILGRLPVFADFSDTIAAIAAAYPDRWAEACKSWMRKDGEATAQPLVGPFLFADPIKGADGKTWDATDPESVEAYFRFVHPECKAKLAIDAAANPKLRFVPGDYVELEWRCRFVGLDPDGTYYYPSAGSRMTSREFTLEEPTRYYPTSPSYSPSSPCYSPSGKQTPEPPKNNSRLVLSVLFDDDARDNKEGGLIGCFLAAKGKATLSIWSDEDPLFGHCTDVPLVAAAGRVSDELDGGGQAPPAKRARVVAKANPEK